MEYVDIYDENGRNTGKSRPRDEQLSQGQFTKVVGMWVFTPEGKILITKRSPEKSFAPNKWENTGGHVSAGETSEEAVIRELEEETGLRVGLDQVTFLGSAKVGGFLGENFSVLCPVDLSQIKLQPGETCDAKLVSYEELLEMAENGAFAPSVMEHMKGYREAFLRVLGEIRTGKGRKRV